MSEIFKASHRRVYGHHSNSSSSSSSSNSISMSPSGSASNRNSTTSGISDNRTKLSHDIVAGAASFEATRLFEDKHRKNGKPVSHAFAKKTLTAFASSEVDKLFEVKELSHLDKNQIKSEAIRMVEKEYETYYGGQKHWSPTFKPITW